MLLHVIDASDPRRAEHIIARLMPCSRRSAPTQIPQILVYNKLDRLEMQPRVDRDANGQAAAVWISAEKRLGLDLPGGLRSPSVSTGSCAGAGSGVPGECRCGAVLAAICREARFATRKARHDDGSIELAVELPGRGAAHPGGADHRGADPGGAGQICLVPLGRRTYNRRPFRGPASTPQAVPGSLGPEGTLTDLTRNRRASPELILWRGINQVRTILGAAGPAVRATVRTSMSA